MLEPNRIKGQIKEWQDLLFDQKCRNNDDTNLQFITINFSHLVALKNVEIFLEVLEIWY